MSAARTSTVSNTGTFGPSPSSSSPPSSSPTDTTPRQADQGHIHPRSEGSLNVGNGQEEAKAGSRRLREEDDYVELLDSTPPSSSAQLLPDETPSLSTEPNAFEADVPIAREGEGGGGEGGKAATAGRPSDLPFIPPPLPSSSVQGDGPPSPTNSTLSSTHTTASAEEDRPHSVVSDHSLSPLIASPLEAEGPRARGPSTGEMGVGEEEVQQQQEKTLTGEEKKVLMKRARKLEKYVCSLFFPSLFLSPFYCPPPPFSFLPQTQLPRNKEACVLTTTLLSLSFSL